MPGMTGLELIKSIKEAGLIDTYFVIVSGYSDFKYDQEAIKYDAYSYILKPAKTKDLENLLAKIHIDLENKCISKDLELYELKYSNVAFVKLLDDHDFQVNANIGRL